MYSGASACNAQRVQHLRKLLRNIVSVYYVVRAYYESNVALYRAPRAGGKFSCIGTDSRNARARIIMIHHEIYVCVCVCVCVSLCNIS